MRARLAALVLALVAAVCVVAALHRDDARAATVTAIGPTTKTPLLSPRRAPRLFASVVAQARTVRNLRTTIGSNNACVAVDESKDDPIVRVDADVPHIPASTLKILTGIAALDHFSAGYRFRTSVVRGPAPNSLVVIGGGDPVLATDAYEQHRLATPRWRGAKFTHLADLADALKRAGVTNVSTLGVDDSRGDTLRYLPQWKPSYATDGEIGALGELTIDGGFSDPIRQVPSTDPALTTGQRLAALLHDRGITVGAVTRARASATAPAVAYVDSPPLSGIVSTMVRASDDFVAEELTRAIGDGSTLGGTTETLTTLQKLGIPTSNLVLDDGSGLARTDAVSCTTMLAAVHALTNPKYEAVRDGLAVAGRTGTLTLRPMSNTLAGNLHAKTGTLDNVTGLVGEIDNSPPTQFAFLAEGGFSINGGDALGDAVARVISDAAPKPGESDALVPKP